MGYVFISYSSKNQAMVDAMRAILIKHRIAHWIAPDDIPAGSNYPKVIGQAIKDCDCMLLLLTNDAQDSPWVPKEVERAINYKKTVIPVQLEELQLNDEFELYLSTSHIMRLKTIDESAPELQKVLSSVIAQTGQHLSTPADTGKKQEPSVMGKGIPFETGSKMQRNLGKGSEKETMASKSLLLPPELLEAAPSELHVNHEELRFTARRLSKFLKDADISGEIIKVSHGAAVTRYEVELETGTSLTRLTRKEDQIALMLGVSGVRIVAMPGKASVVGIEVPNSSAATVSLREVIDSPEFTLSASKVMLAVGKDIDGNNVVADLAKLPHMLISGGVNSGMVSFLNSLIVSLLHKASPDEAKLVLIDLKKVDFAAYRDIPHLLLPVMNTTDVAVGALQWLEREMMNRFQRMASACVRDLEQYNRIMENQGGEKLPRIVVIVNEFADLIRASLEKVETAVCRIAQLGRAAGIHLILATRRPSNEVYPGLIRANFPSRLSFAVASPAESRYILDVTGAEKLLGRGDMLYEPIGSHTPLRIQSCFVKTQEVQSVVQYLRHHGTTEYDKQAMEEIERIIAPRFREETDDFRAAAAKAELDLMLPSAVEVILETGVASVSVLQRKLRLGFGRASRIMDEMESCGIVGPYQGSKPRKILITWEQWHEMKDKL